LKLGFSLNIALRACQRGARVAVQFDFNAASM